MVSKSAAANERQSWYEEKQEIKRLYAAKKPVQGSFPKERLLAARPGTSGPFYKEWVGKFPIVLRHRDAGVKRVVNFEVSTWAGMSLGAVHFYAEVEEHDDEFFVPKEVQTTSAFEGPVDRWWSCELPDGSNKGRQFKVSVMEREDAERFILALMHHVFPAEKYEHRFSAWGADHVFRETKVAAKRIVLPVTEMKMLNATWSHDGNKKLECHVKVGDYVKVHESDEPFDRMVRAEACDKKDSIGRVVEVKLSKPDRKVSDEGYWEQYFAVIDEHRAKTKKKEPTACGYSGLPLDDCKDENCSDREHVRDARAQGDKAWKPKQLMLRRRPNAG